MIPPLIKDLAPAAPPPVLITAPAPTAPVAPQAITHEEPRAGGNYLRDPITGALTANPAHAEPSDSKVPQE